MADISWTPSQLRAITANAPHVLVSAAAGSGKTTVLTERIIRRLCDKDDPYDLSRILVVTFTKAATADLKEQISSALRDALARTPSDAHLSRQLSLLPSAQISTIHSFCFSLIRRYFQTLSLPSSLRIAEENEARLLAIEVMEQLLEDLYEGGDGAFFLPDFSLMVDQLVSLDDRDLGQTLLSLYERLLCLPEGIALLDRCAAAYDECKEIGFFSTIWGRILLDEISDAISYFESVLALAVSDVGVDQKALKKYGEAFDSDLAICRNMLHALKHKDIETMRRLVSEFAPVPIRSIRYPDPPATISDGASVHGEMKEYFRRLKEKCYLQSDSLTNGSASICSRLSSVICRLLSEYDRRFTAEKLRRGIVDFADLERYTLTLLTDENGSPSVIATQISAQYREIYIDEYQDVNEVQDRIFSAISCRCRRFMVGDIKQSIYAFRGSAPHLFASYRTDPNIETVFLAENFRSDRTIIDFSNAVFSHLFGTTDREMPYTDRDALVCGKPLESQRHIPVTVALLPSNEVQSEGDENYDAEAAYVANKISELIANGTSPSDIVILLRSPSTTAPAYEKALQMANIDCLNKEKQSLLENEEILLLLSLLRVIDNPRRDIDLAAVLRSPLYGLTLDDLVRIRACGEGCLYDALLQYQAEHQTENISYFLIKLDQYRSSSRASSVDRLIWMIMEDSGIASLRISEKSAAQSASRANLLMFYDYARAFESGSYRGLSKFISYIGGIIDSDGAGRFKSPETGKNEASSVRILSIHASKGLQFPVTFLCGCGRKINDRDSTGNLLFDRDLGIATKLSDDSGLARYDTPFRLASSRRIHEKTVFEEMRVLYVALTRAKQRLIVTGSFRDTEEARRRAFCNARCCPKGCLYPLSEGQPSYMSWILTALSAKGFVDYELELKTDMLSAEDTQSKKVPNLADRYSEEEIQSALAELRSRYSYEYPHAALRSIPAKMTVSGLYPSLLDPELDGMIPSDRDSGEFRMPRFLQSEGISGADKGTATHLFMQFCDFSRVTERGVDEEIQRLVHRAFITEEIARLIDRGALVRFFASDLLLEMKNAADLRREIRFNMNLPARSFTTDAARAIELGEEKILVQGVIDCIYQTQAGEWVLVDYKTDRIPNDLRGDRDKEDAFLTERHLSQLRYYKLALEKMLCCRVSRVLLWSFSLARSVDLTSLCDGDA